jgi:hypothetical protein
VQRDLKIVEGGVAARKYGWLELGKYVQHREGVVWCTAAVFVTFNKDDKQHSETTAYTDYAISPKLFQELFAGLPVPELLEADGHGLQRVLGLP